jgi:hypothetical protein
MKDDKIGSAHKTQGKMRNAYKILVGVPHVRRPDRRFRQIWDCDIKMYLGEVGVALDSAVSE